MMIGKIALISLVLPMLSGTVYKGRECTCEAPPPSLTQMDDLISVSKDQVTIGQATLKLRSYIGIDPLFGIENVFCGTTLTEVGAKPLPESIILLEQYIFNRGSVWVPSFDEKNITKHPTTIKRYANNGPKWKASDGVTIIVRLFDQRTCSEHYLIEKQKIGCDC